MGISKAWIIVVYIFMLLIVKILKTITTTLLDRF